MEEVTVGQALALSVVGLAVFRVARLAVLDDILDPWRDWWFERFPPTGMPIDSGDGSGAEPSPGSFLGDLVTCVWCIGFWIAVVAWVLFLLWPGVTVVLSIPWALSAVAGLLSER